MNKKLKTVIVIDNMCIGGIATSLYNFLNCTDKWLECDLLAFRQDSIEPERLPAGVRILKPCDMLCILGMSQKEIKSKSLWLALCRAVLVLTARLISGQFARGILFAFFGKLQGYDLAISFAQDNGWKSLSKGCNDFVAKKIIAKHKAAFIHCDYANFGGYDSRQEKMLAKLDAIACVSESCTKSFVSIFPNLQQRCITCENFTDVSNVREKAEPAVTYNAGTANFVTVCRLSIVKGLTRTVEAFGELYRDGYQNFSWTIVGDGPEKESLLDAVKQNGLDEKIIFVGDQKNPYPYMKNATVFLLPSLHEAAPMVYGESAALGVPILTTRTCSAVELVQNRKLGIVVENSKAGIKQGIRRVLEDPTCLKEIGVSADFINENAYIQVRKFINDIASE